MNRLLHPQQFLRIFVFDLNHTLFVFIKDKKNSERERNEWRLILLRPLLVDKHCQNLFSPPTSWQVCLFKVCIILISLFYFISEARTTKNTQKEGTGKKLDRTYRKSHFRPGFLVYDHIIYHLNRKIWEIVLHTMNK